jgi:AcrR family transcriptional regulator
MPTRKYEQRVRAQGAEATRERILAAVYERISEAPTEPLSVDRVARKAGVARSTVYLVFGSRSGLFDAFAAHLWERAGFDRLVENVARPIGRENLRGNVRIGVEMYAAHRDVFNALYSMSRIDPEAVGGAIQRWEERRSRGMTAQAGRLAYEGMLRAGLSPEDAAHLIWVYTSFDAFDLLYTGRGMTVEETAQLLIDMYDRTVLAEPLA